MYNLGSIVHLWTVLEWGIHHNDPLYVFSNFRQTCHWKTVLITTFWWLENYKFHRVLSRFSLIYVMKLVCDRSLFPLTLSLAVVIYSRGLLSFLNINVTKLYPNPKRTKAMTNKKNKMSLERTVIERSRHQWRAWQMDR